MTRLKSFLPWILLFAPLPALAASGRYAISSENVAGAMATMGMQVSPTQLTLLSDPVATTTNPQLRVQSMQRWPGDKIVARLECATTQQCLPFFVSVRLGNMATSQIAAASDSPAPEPAIRSTPAMVVHAGSPATLYIEGDHIHIRVAVRCLQSGAIGQTIRAEGPDRQQTYTAQVAGAGVLKGRL
ncbi:MAG TPA: flagella basal body P-ring formation protein FlgA [Acidobacteriaceae bacterium]|nr:flagella basal body P-ring formation protein FlgA [Acidobacteriaceae bacterium]